jgi:small subunit ribosomal protein S20|tara:strand:+ start:176 stop:430 length:255 start_codon:yes stop_codon:yes gene_type:complete
MANHKSALKRVRSDEKKRDRNRYQHKTMRNAIRKLRASTNLKEVTEMLPLVSSMLDKLAKNNVIHKNKASNLKSSIAAHTTALK